MRVVEDLPDLAEIRRDDRPARLGHGFGQRGKELHAVPKPERADEAHGRLVRKVYSSAPLGRRALSVRLQLGDVDAVGVDEHTLLGSPLAEDDVTENVR